MSSFFQKVYQLVSEIPPGRVASYGQIARLLEAPHNARVVGWAMRQSPEAVPAHRIVKRSGELAPEAVFGAGVQKAKLEQEGVAFDENGRIRMEAHAWER
ncbi:MGMT family protein [Shouchella shacheensis]|uniref:MGMT family protein n=1 Tax=Shouchella shacheensis TaxID=1649580 RepID=UPI001FE1572C|nr:methylated-DNA--[protein]-cysteine S-methyltransferase [Shouchella shacheensis]